MRKFSFLVIVLIIGWSYSFFSCGHQDADSGKWLVQKLSADIDDFSSSCNALKLAEEKDAHIDSIRKFFLKARLAYKQFEWAAEYFVPATSRFVNGAPVPEVELSGQVFKPAGLQVIEGLLFPTYDPASKTALLTQLSSLQAACNTYKNHFENIGIFDWQVLDACKLEVFRVETLGITGFDNPLTLQSMRESSFALESLVPVLKWYDNKETNDLSKKIHAASSYLLEHNDFNAFDRATFITAYCDPVTSSMSKLQQQLPGETIRYNRLLNQDAPTLSDTGAFNVNAYAPGPAAFITPEKIALGQLLFADPMLSASGTRSCQTCHQPAKAFTDGLIKNTAIDDTTMLPRNTPTLINAAFQPSLFYDLRVRTLEDQSLNVVQNPKEMHGSLQVSVKRLWRDTAYRRLFELAFPKKNRVAIDTLEVMNAIGSYVRSLVNLNSRFDEYMRGNKTALNTTEINGFNLFMGKAKCATCHYMPLFNGSLPPRYMKIESEVIGVPSSVKGTSIDPDLGRYNIIKTPSFLHAFKIPTVRNASRTAPYMHNGVFMTLEQVMDFYNKGGGTGLGLPIDNQTLPFDQLNLSAVESAEIIAFIKSLDSK